MDDFMEALKRTLPPLVTRQELERLTGGLVKARTLANLDCAGNGPSQRIRYGRKIAYERSIVLTWLAKHLEVKSV